ncbi:hypothetical protein Tco_0824829 [Tanacetum coccineum]
MAVHAGDKTSGDARSWYIISGDAKSWIGNQSQVVLLSVGHAALVVLHDALRALVVRQTQLVDIESEPKEAPSKTEELQSLGFRVPLMGEEFETVKPSGTRTDSSHSSASSDSTTPLSPDHPLTHVSPTPTPTRASFYRRIVRMTVRVQPAMSPGYSARVTEAMALSDSAFRKRYRSSYETPSSSSYLALPVRKRYRDTSELILDTDSEGVSWEMRILRRMRVWMRLTRERGQIIRVIDSSGCGYSRGEPIGLGYGVARHRALESIEDITPSTYEVDPEDDRVYTDITIYPLVAPVQTSLSPEWSSGSLPNSLSSHEVPSPIASLMATPTATISVNEDHFLEVGAQLELHGSILQDHTQRLDALLPTLIADIDRSLEHEQERTAVTFGALWRPVLALEA